eukprot:gene9773-1973_t
MGSARGRKSASVSNAASPSRRGTYGRGSGSNKFLNNLTRGKIWKIIGLFSSVAVVFLAFYFGVFRQEGQSIKNQSTGPVSLIDEVLRTHNIVNHEHKHASSVYPRATLAYVTPWNNKGYDIAKEYNGKFTHVSPVWLQMKKGDGNSSFVITGEHDIDQNWMKAVRKPSPVTNHVAKIVPRVIVEGFAFADFVALFENIDYQRDDFINTLLQTCGKHKFDGIVLEVWSRLQVSPEIRSALVKLMRAVGDAFKVHGLSLILVVPPSTSSFGPSEFSALADYVDYFSVNTYDYSSPTTAGPNAPYDWVEGSITTLLNNAPDDHRITRKILLGLNFYGNLYTPSGGRPIIGHEYIGLLSKAKGNLVMKWNAKAREHVIEGNRANINLILYFPTLRSIQERVQLAQNLDVGICIWDIGQGLDSFFNLI